MPWRNFENCAKGIPKSFQSQFDQKGIVELWNCPFPDIFQHLPVFSRGYTTNACPSQTHEALGIGRPESARPELWNSCVENVAAKLLGVNSLADVSHLPVMEFRAILHLILHWFLFYHFFPFLPISSHSFPFFSILFFSILSDPFPFCPILSHCFPFFLILFSFLPFFLLSYFFFSHFFLSYFKLLHAISHYFSVFFSEFLVCDSPAAQFSSGVPSSGEISATTPVTCTAHQCRR